MLKKAKENIYRPNEEGYVLITVILLIAVIAVLGVSITGITLKSVTTSTDEHDDQSAFYIAEAGVNLAINEMDNIVNSLDPAENPLQFFNNLKIEFKELEEALAFDFEEVPGNIKKSTFDISIDDINNGENSSSYVVTSIGMVDNSKRSVQQTLDITLDNSGSNSELPDTVLMVKDGINIEESSSEKSVVGDIGTIKSGKDTIIVKYNSVNGSYFAPLESKLEAVKIPNQHGKVVYPGAENIDEKGSFPELPPFKAIPEDYRVLPDEELFRDSNSFKVIDNGDLLITDYKAHGYVLNMKENLEFNNIKFNANRELYINTGGTEKELVVRNLDLSNGHIKIIGEGKLTIYVTESISFSSGSTLNAEGNVKQLDLFLKGEQNVDLAGSQKIVGSVYSESGDINLGAGGGIKGNIFTGGNEIRVSGGTWVTSPLILAPNADFYHTGGAKIYGKIFAKSYYKTGGGKLIQSDLEFTEGPISSENIAGDNVGVVKTKVNPTIEIEINDL